ADPPGRGNPGKGQKERQDPAAQQRPQVPHGGTAPRVQVTVQFGERDRLMIRDYYGAAIARGHCPPGLAKKNNGCRPPGLARQYAIGQPLPRHVIFHDLPPQLVVQLSLPPPGYRYVRVASDILLIAIGTGLVAAAIQDLAQF
ncbi:MAG: RcnB family protein, partial [Alphaproteobacteria bacterium]|nr:RcnB family protein [Alphaproteobacteria bacterium]